MDWTRRLSSSFLGVLGLLALMVVAAQGIVQQYLAVHERSSEVVNMAGRQRMLSQRLVQQALYFGPTPSPDRQAELTHTLDAWRTGGARLRDGDLSIFVASQGDPVARRLEEVEERLESSILPYTEPEVVTPHQPSELVALGTAYLDVQDEMVFAFSERQDRLLRRTRWISALLSIGKLLIVLGLGFGLVRPVLARLRASVARERASLRDLQASRARHARALAGSTDALWDYAPDAGLHWSAQAWTLLGVPPQPHPSWEQLAEIVIEEDRDEVSRQLGAARRGGRIDVAFRVPRDGGTAWLQLRGSPTGDGYVSGALADIDAVQRLTSERARLQATQELERQRHQGASQERARMLEAVGSLAAGVAHDLNNTLQIISLAAAELRQSGADTESIRQAVEAASTLSGQLLAITPRFDQTLERSPVHMEEWLHQTTPILERLLPDGASLRVHIEEPLPTCDVDSGQLRQALVQLVMNAREAIGGHGEVRIVGRRARAVPEGGTAQDGVELRVEDDGVGMDAEVSAHAFEPFFTTHDRTGGRGLGLSIVQGTLGRHGGRVDLETAEGHGCVVRVWLPVSPSSRDQPDPPVARTAPARVLFIDDNQALVDMMRRMIPLLGFEGCFAHDGASAVEVFRAAEDDGGVQIVICDVMLADERGPEVVDALRQGIHRHLGVVYVSGYHDVQLDFSVPHTTFLAKPFLVDDLKQAIARVWP